jgi:hypothetical protein
MMPISDDFKHFKPKAGAQGIKKPIYSPVTGQTEWVTQIDYDQGDKSYACVVCKDFGYVNIHTPRDGLYQDFSYRCYCSVGDKACPDVKQISKLHWQSLSRKRLTDLGERHD